jgi:chemotaxis protein methyltransferase CheR
MKDREFNYTDADFTHVREMVFQHAGISLTEAKSDLVYNRLSKRLRLLKLKTFREYFQYVEEVGEQEFVNLINAITTNLTSFFRENHHFEYLAKTVFPELLKKNRDSKRIRIWSAGCSTGEEPYSLAMVVRENIPLQAGWDVKILATDLDSNVVATGKEGVYDAERIDDLPVERIKRYFLSGKDEQQGKVRVSKELKELITFKQLNLMHDWPMKGPFDIILCRNVVIYFNKDTQRKLVGRYENMLSNKGYLFIGHSESLYKLTDRFELIGKTIYRKV